MKKNLFRRKFPEFDRTTWAYVSILLSVAILVLATVGSYKMPESRAVELVEKFGYTNVVITERFNLWSAELMYKGPCGRGTAAEFKIAAIDPANKPVGLIACVGFLQLGTIAPQ